MFMDTGACTYMYVHFPGVLLLAISVIHWHVRIVEVTLFGTLSSCTTILYLSVAALRLGIIFFAVP